MNITPAILPHSFEEITEKLSRLEGLVTRVQIDLCDGVFGREKTWLPTGTEALPTEFSYEFDIMMNHWSVYVPYAISIGATCIVAHMDMFSDEDITNLVAMVTPRNIALGIAVSNDKSVDFHADMVRKTQALYPNVFIQIMGINKIGEQGQFFNEETPERVKEMKKRFGEMKVQVDGGIKLDSAKKLSEVGTDTIVVGSYIFGHDDVGASLEELNVAVNG